MQNQLTFGTSPEKGGVRHTANFATADHQKSRKKEEESTRPRENKLAPRNQSQAQKQSPKEEGRKTKS